LTGFWDKPPFVPAPEFDFYLISDRHQTRGRDLLWILEEALEAGLKAIQLREKDLDGRHTFQLAERVRKLCDQYGAQLLINDRIDVALAVAAAGVQLGNASLPIEVARTLLGPRALIGASTHSLDEANQAVRSGADFVVFGPVFFTPSKAAFGAPQGLRALKEIVENVALPVYAIGGIKLENMADVLTTGVCGIALISGVIAAVDPRSASRSFLDSLRGAGWKK
jgi:thiamine-phosphate pyrophosphorylase